MKKITKKELKTILEQHKLWLDSNEEEGKCADLSDVNLRRADLPGADLIGADLRRANLSDANLYRTNLTGADLTGANLSSANFFGADLSRVDLSGADLSGAYLTSANLSSADLTGANLRGADLEWSVLTGADLRRADLTHDNLNFAVLTNTILDEKEQCRKGIMLTEPITGYKKANNNKIITLEIPIGAKVFSINNDKRRTNKAKVIDMQGETELSSWYNTNFKYHVGDEIEITDFDENYNVECAEGVHFFLTRKEAEFF